MSNDTKFDIGHKIKLSRKQIEILSVYERDIEKLEQELGKSRAIYVAMEQNYIKKRTETETRKIEAIKQMAREYDIPLESEQRWDYHPIDQEFERKE